MNPNGRPQGPPETPPSRVIADLLAQSRAAHLQKKHHAGRANKAGTVTKSPDYPQAEQAIREAICTRCEAHQLDPDKLDPAWAQDEAINRVSSERLLAWFETYLTLP